MDINNQTDNSQEQFEVKKEKPKSIGALIGLFVILVVLTAGVLYFWGQRLEKTQVTGETSETVLSDDINSIETDLNINEPSIDEEINQIDLELK